MSDHPRRPEPGGPDAHDDPDPSVGRRQQPADHPDEQAALHERAEGANAEQLPGPSNLRADDTPPGVDPDEEEDHGHS
jgi:hypothetical protein